MDDTSSLLRNIIARLSQVELAERADAMEAFSITYANSNQGLRRITENRSKVDFLIRAFANPHFEKKLGGLCINWLESMYLVTWSVSF